MANLEVTIELDSRGNFTYKPSTFHLFNFSWERKNVVWKCEHPFCVDFGDRSLFKHFRYSSRQPKDYKDDPHPNRTRKAKLHRAGGGWSLQVPGVCLSQGTAVRLKVK